MTLIDVDTTVIDTIPHLTGSTPFVRIRDYLNYFKSYSIAWAVQCIYTSMRCVKLDWAIDAFEFIDEYALYRFSLHFSI